MRIGNINTFSPAFSGIRRVVESGINKTSSKAKDNILNSPLCSRIIKRTDGSELIYTYSPIDKNGKKVSVSKIRKAVDQLMNAPVKETYGDGLKPLPF